MGISDQPNSSQTFPITGVVSDFNSTSLHDAIKPLFIVPSSSMSTYIEHKTFITKSCAIQGHVDFNKKHLEAGIPRQSF